MTDWLSVIGSEVSSRRYRGANDSTGTNAEDEHSSTAYHIPIVSQKMSDVTLLLFIRKGLGENGRIKLVRQTRRENTISRTRCGAPKSVLVHVSTLKLLTCIDSDRSRYQQRPG